MIERIDRDRERVLDGIRDSEARLSEWTPSPDVDAALDFYNRIVDLIQGRVNQAKGAQELNAALADVLSGIWMSLEDNGVLRAQFALREPGRDFVSVAGTGRWALDDPLPSAWCPPKPTTEGASGGCDAPA